MSSQAAAETASPGPGSATLADYPQFRCRELDQGLAEALVARTLDANDVRLREMTRDLSRFSSEAQLARWRPGRDLLCLQDDLGSLVGVFWVVEKPIPERDDYRDPPLIRKWSPSLTCAIRTYGSARGHGFLTKAFAEQALERLLRKRSTRPSLWYETKAHNTGARALGWQLGFFEASGEAGGTGIGVRFRDY